MSESSWPRDARNINVALTAYPFTERDFRTISAILHEDAGIYLPDAKQMLVYSRLTKRLRALGLENFRDYCALVTSNDGVDERQRLIAALTTNVTSFFREQHHFEHLRNYVIGPKAAEVRKGARLRIWSAACSDGQEPYSIAMSVLSVIPEASQLDIRVLATDIDPNVINAGRAGVYSDEAIKSVPKALRDRWFSFVDDGATRGWAVGEDLSELVSFRELNLVKPWPMKGKFDAIFCRNVVIYFEETTQQAIWRRFAPVLNQSGRLYIGHSERVSGPATESFLGDGITTYRLRDGSVS